MNHYPHHIGDFVKDTMGFSQGAIGAYRLLMDAYYANEEAPAAEDVYVIGRATTPAERKNVDRALTKFTLKDGRYCHKRVEEELAAFRARSETGGANANKRWQKNAKNDAKPHATTMPKEMPEECQTVSEGHAAEMLASSHKPEVQKPSEKQRYEARDIPDSAGSRGAAALEELKTKALTLDEAKIPGGPQTAAGVLASVLKANNCRGNAFHPTVIEWAMLGITVDRLKAAIAKARQRPGKEHPASIDCSYLDPIVREDEKPAGDTRWRTDDDAAVAKGRELGLEAKRGEDFYAFRQRIGEALSERARRTVQ